MKRMVNWVSVLSLFVAMQGWAQRTDAPAAPSEVGSPCPTVSGSGSVNRIAKFLGPCVIGNSDIFNHLGRVGILKLAPTATLDVDGDFNLPLTTGSTVGVIKLGDTPFIHAFGLDDTFVGLNAGNFVSTEGNTAIGSSALTSLTTGTDNTASGTTALASNTSGAGNTASGLQALTHNTTGNDNTAFGVAAGANGNMTGSLNTFIGAFADGAMDGLTNATAIGDHAIVGASNSLVLGGTGANAVNVGIGTAAPSNVFTIAQGAGHAISDGWDVYSSRRWKTNIHTLQGALDTVQRLRGVSYNLTANGKHEIGVIAEEVGAVVPELVTWNMNGKDAEGVDYMRLTALLIEATKEQQTFIDNQQRLVNAQQAQIAQLASQLKMIQASIATRRGNDPVARVAKTHNATSPRQIRPSDSD
jgi:hypothetical protein